MTTQQREQWNSRRLAKLRTGLQRTLVVLSYTSEQDKEEIESRVMDALREEVANVSDDMIERTSLTRCIEDDMNTDALVMGVLQEQQYRNEWGR
jgi:hypothetical protein